MQKIEYVLKISSAYYRPVIDKEILKDIENIEQNTADEEVKCMVSCWDSSDVVFMQCGHGGVCLKCAQKIRKKQVCYICRRWITCLVKINADIDNNKGNLYEVTALSYAKAKMFDLLTF